MNRSIRHPKYLAAVATLALCLPLLVQAQSAAGSATTAAPSVSQPAVPPYAGQETHQGHGMHRGTHHGMHHGMHHGKHARDEGHGMGEGMHLLRGLKLSAAQRDQVFELMHKQAPAMREQAKAIRAASEELRSLSLSGQFDEGRAKALSDALGAAMTERSLARARTGNAVFQLLTPEQQRQLAQRRARDGQRFQPLG
jgi:Spy/CpxP family protein refolding chaperone